MSLCFCARSCPARPELIAVVAAPIIIPDVMELATLADVRILVEKHLPAMRPPSPARAFEAVTTKTLRVAHVADCAKREHSIKSHANGGTMQDFLNLMLILSVVGVPPVIMFTNFW